MKFTVKLLSVLLCAFCLVSCSSSAKYYKITFISEGETAYTSLQVKEGSEMVLPTEPTKAGYIFGGWYLDSATTEKYTNSAAPTSDFTLYARWVDENAKYTVSFDALGGESVTAQEILIGDSATAPKTERLGYQLAGWCVDNACETPYDFATPVTESITLYAKWDRVYVLGVQLSDSFVLFNSNRQEKENKQTEFADLTQDYLVGIDNPWIVLPEADFVTYDGTDYDEVTVSKWQYVLKLYVYDGTDYVLVEDQSVYVDEFDELTCELDFKDTAIGKEFKVNIIPSGLTENQQARVEDFTVSFVCSVVEGYNAYNALDLAYIESRSGTAEADAWNAFKTAKGLDVDYHPTMIIFHDNISVTTADIPDHFFFMEDDADISPADADYARALHSMRDYAEIYFHNFVDDTEFHLYGNYFTLSAAALPYVTRDENHITVEGDVISHSTLIRIQGVDTASASIKNCNIIGNAPRVEDVVKSGGLILLKVQGPTFDAYNNLTACAFITYMPNYTFKPFTMTKCKAYDSFNCFIYNWGSDLVYVNECEMIGAGGPVIIQDHIHPEDPTHPEYKIAKTYITNSRLESYVAGSEGWFSIMNATGAAAQIKGLDQVFNPWGKSFLKSSSDGSITYLNLICVNKSGSAEGLTGEKIKGVLQIDGASFDFGETNPYLAGMLEVTFGAGAPAFQTSTAALNAGIAYYGGGNFLKDVTNADIMDSANGIFQGDYLCIYYNGMALTMGYYSYDAAKYATGDGYQVYQPE